MISLNIQLWKIAEYAIKQNEMDEKFCFKNYFNISNVWVLIG